MSLYFRVELIWELINYAKLNSKLKVDIDQELLNYV